MNGWRSITKFLQDNGVKHVFGLPGTQNAELFSELESTDIRIVTCVHEMSAGFAAIGNSIARGKPSVLLNIAGPGFCYTTAPLVEACHDSVPVLNIVIAKKSLQGRRFQLQDIDHIGIAKRVAKAAVHVNSTAELCQALNWSWHTTMAGEPGPVVVFIESHVLDSEQNPNFAVSPMADDSDDSPPMLRPAMLDRLASGRVLIYAGRGAASASDQLLQLVEERSWAVMTTLSGRGVIPESHPLALVIDQRDIGAANAIIDKFDMVLALGVKFSHNGSVGFRLDIARDKLIHVDASQDVLGANLEAATVIRSDIGRFLDYLSTHLGASEHADLSHTFSEDRDKLYEAKPKQSLEPIFHAGREYTAESWFAAIQHGMLSESVYVSDSGLHQLLLRRHFVAEFANQLITPSDFQSMGFGLPAAIGAATAFPSRSVVVIHGDGGFHMVAMDLMTAVEHKLALRVIVLADGSYGLIRQQQLKSGLSDHGTTLPQLDYAGLAEAVGVGYVDAAEGLEQVFEYCERVTGPVLIRQPISDSDDQTKAFAQMRLRGRFKQMLSPRVLSWIRRRKGL